MDSLAAAGVTFTQAHSANAVCTPSRYSLLTGIYNWRKFQGISGHYGFKSGIDNIPTAGDSTLADFLKAPGYHTAAFGKWHLGGKWFGPGGNTRITTNPETPSAVIWTRRVEGHATDIGFDYLRSLATAINFGPYVYLQNDTMQYWVNDSGPPMDHERGRSPAGRGRMAVSSGHHLHSQLRHRLSLHRGWRHLEIHRPHRDRPQKWGTGGEIELWPSTDQGATWAKQRAVTKASQRNHSYARRARNTHPEFYSYWADDNSNAFSESHLYFTNSRGNRVWELPYDMIENAALPKLIDP